MQPSPPAHAPLSRPMKVWRARVFFATWLGYIGYYFARKPFYIAKASLGDELGWDASRLGLLGSVYLVAYSIGQFVAGTVGDRVGARLLVLVGLAITITTNLLFGLTNSWATFAALMAIHGLAQATGWPGNLGSIAPWFTRRERGTVLGFWSTNFQVGGVVANGAAAWVLGAFGFRYAFFACSAFSLLVWFNFLFNQRNNPESVGLEPLHDPDEVVDAETGREGRAEWTRPIVVNVLIVGAFYFCVKFIRYALWSWAPYLLQKTYGLEADNAGYLSTVFDIAGIVGVVTIGFLSDRFFSGRRARIAFIFILGMLASTALLYTAGQHSLVVFGVSMGFIGFTLYGPDALMTGAGAIDVGSRRGATKAAGIINGMGSVGSVAQELLLGRLLDKGGVAVVFGALIFAAVGAAVALSALLWRNRTGKADM